MCGMLSLKKFVCLFFMRRRGGEEEMRGEVGGEVRGDVWMFEGGGGLGFKFKVF